MPLEMRKTSKWWYGRYNLDGKVHCVNLKLLIEGKRPASMRIEGDKTFEISRAKAQVKFDEMLADIRQRQRSEEYVQQLHKIRTGRRIASIPLPQLAAAWDKAPRKRKGSVRYIKQAHSLFARFVAFVQQEYRDTETLADVTPDMAEAFMQEERERGVSGRTSNAALILLRSAFKALANRANIVRNPFDGIPTVSEDTTHRKPFSQAELEAILDAAKDDDFIRPIIITGMFTAMRRGDCCTLRWGDVDLDEGFVRVKTSKTGETVEIPMLGLLRSELEFHLKNLGRKAPAAEDFVFPKAARMYKENAQGITYRVRKAFENAGFFDAAIEDEVEDEPDTLEEVEKPVLKKRVLKMLSALTNEDGSETKRKRMAEAFRRYVDGDSLPAVAEVMGISKSSVSLYLHEIEKRTGLRVIPKPKKRVKQRASIRTRPEGGARRVSVRDFHSFRVTWITLALSAGVPLELVQRVTGHKTTQVVLKHYFKPGRDAFKKAIESAMPTLVAGPSDARTVDVVAEETAEYGDTPGPGALLEKALIELSAVKSKSKRLANAVELITQAKHWVNQRVIREAATQ